jgi:hypothetical protein
VSIDIPDVHAGQLITASFMNDVIDTLEDLDARLTKLEEGGGSTPPAPSGAIVIDSVSPTTVRVGEDLTIKGKNFGDTLGASAVTIGGEPPALIRSWTGTQIVVVVPSLPEEDPLPTDGASVTLEVSNFFTSQSRVITVKPRQQTQTGSIGIQPEDVSPDPITSGTDNYFKFSITAHTLLATEATLAAKVTGQTWAATVLDDQKKAIPGNKISLNPETSKSVFVRIPIPSGTNQAGFQVELTTKAPGLPDATTTPLSYKVGDFADPDTNFTMVPTKVLPASAGSGATITAAASGDMTELYWGLVFSAPGTYNVIAETVPSPLLDWFVQVSNPAPGANGKSVIKIPSADSGNTVQKTVQINVQPKQATSQNAQLRLRVQEENATKSRSFTYDLRAKA